MKPTPITRDVHRPIPRVCVGCKEAFGLDMTPVDIPEDNGDGKGKTERWCPQCFVGIRAYRDARWLAAVRMGQLLAVTCMACKVTSVDFGRRQCSQCGSKQLVILLPKGTVLKVGALRRAGLLS
jgi:hypothetical protein